MKNYTKEQYFKDWKLLRAIETKNIEGIKTLLKSGANPNQSFTNSATALSFVQQIMGLDVVKLMIAHKADPNMRDQGGRNSLALAIDDKNLEQIEYFLKQGTSIRTVDIDERTPIDHAVLRFICKAKPKENKCLKAALSTCYVLKFQPRSAENYFVKDFTICQRIYDEIAKECYDNKLYYTLNNHLLDIIEFSVSKHRELESNMLGITQNFKGSVKACFMSLKAYKITVPKVLRNLISSMVFDEMFDNELERRINRYCGV